MILSRRNKIEAINKEEMQHEEINYRNTFITKLIKTWLSNVEDIKTDLTAKWRVKSGSAD